MWGGIMGDGPEIPFDVTKVVQVEEEFEPTSAIVFFGLCMVLGIGSRHALRGTRVPYTVALLVIGVGLGSLEFGTDHRLGKLGAGIRLWASINPDLLLAIFLPALLFESAFLMEVHQIKRCIGQMLILAGPGVLISTFCLGSAMKLAFPYNWTWKTSLLLAGLLSATDPVAVVALLKELGASKKLSTIIEGESLMNDGTAIVVYQLFYRMVQGESFSFGDIVKFLSQVSLGAVAIGLAFGVASVLWLGFIFNDTIIEISLTLAVSYLAYFTAQDGAGVSGVLTVMTLGMFYSAVARTAFKGESQHSLHHFWEMISYIANTLIFILSGVVIAESVLHSENYFFKHETSWGYLILLYVFVQVSRVIVVGTLYPFLRYFGYGLEWKEATILVWSGLRGAVALSLSLSVKRASDSSAFLNRETGALFLFFTGGIVFLTLIVNGSTTQFVLHFLGMDKLSAAKRRILDYTRYEMMNKAHEAFSDLGDDEELGPAEWSTVKKHLACLNNLEEDQVHPHSVSRHESSIHAMNLTDTRVRLLNGVQAAYWGMLDEGRIAQNTATILIESVDEAIDLVSDDSLCDWKGLKSHVHFPSYYRLLQMSICPRKLVTYFTVERLEFACYICAAFLRAHRIARRQLHEFIGESEIASLVINESESEGEEARCFLEEVRVTFPQVLHVVKTRQVTYAVLKHLSEYVQNLEKVGILEEKEMIHLHDSVQTDLKKVLRNPPLAKMPKISDMLRVHPLLRALPSIARVHIEESTKEVTKLRGVTLCKEGTKPNGIWLISNGIVKWGSKNFRNKHSLHPSFSHGSTLGLYEVLIGKPYICDLITDSVVHCFFVESDKILSLLRSDPAVEGILWKESAVAIAKILLPQIFEKMAMQELRSIVAERSEMNIFLRGEIIEIPPHSIGFLFEGFVRIQTNPEELVASPGVLLPSYGDLSFLNLETSVTRELKMELEVIGSGAKAASFCHQGTSYEVDSRARIIIFDMAAVEADTQLQRRTSSRISAAAEPSRGLNREHGGLMSWPEHMYKSQHSQHELGSSYRNSKSFKVSRSFKTSQRKEQHSQSYPRVPSGKKERSLVAVQSEGSNNVRKTSFKVKDFARPDDIPLSRNRNESGRDDNSSEDSGKEEELIVRIDSPSSLSFQHP
ncbi:sodium/hydrogen exchanger 8-like isoform X2 [Papaver somniferum]|uniref:sodium/hydrogen exchanger 8-like isoform X2 n=1 Tax=Papaver somniferum TaxID=3469 RepID=UPI000E6F90DA|nr:sodium/hydrogen exchanger 8-like isoform X2 [Papaver somniferum]